MKTPTATASHSWAYRKKGVAIQAQGWALVKASFLVSFSEEGLFPHIPQLLRLHIGD